MSTVSRCSEISKDFVFILKPHPRERGDYKAYSKYYEKYLHKFDSFAILSKNHDTYEAMWSCDILLTLSSTTALEALIMSKIVMILNEADQLQSDPYVESGAAIGVDFQDNLPIMLKDIISRKDLQDQMEANREKFVLDQVFLQDGKASSRVVDLIYSLMQQS
jgi:UDP-N-acetylglucosamine 2-epimerase